MTTEEWRPIPGFADYFITADGEVGSTRQSRGRVLRPLRWGYTVDGYPKVRLYLEPGKHADRAVHVLVAAAFIGPKPDGMEVRHRDGDRLNPRASNLLYGSRSDNVLDSVRHGTHAQASKTHCKWGHAFDEVNTRVRGRTRECRACWREKSARYRARRALAAANVRIAA
jgi:hypothetical protein